MKTMLRNTGILLISVLMLMFAGCGKTYFEVQYSTTYGTVKSITVESGTKLTAEQLPVLSQEGYEFLGWYIGDTKIEAGYEVSENITLTAKWKETKTTITNEDGSVTVTVREDDGTIVETTTNTDGSTVVETTSPDGSKEVVETAENGDTKVTTTDKDGNTTTITTVIDDDGNKTVTTVNSDGTTTVSKVDKDGEAVTYTVTYSTDKGTKPAVKKVSYGTKLTAVDLPELKEDGYNFGGWYIGEKKVEADFVVSADVTLTAKWEKKSVVTITYKSDKGTVPEAIKVEKDTALTADHLPILKTEEMILTGWYIGTTKITAGYKVTEDITLTAKWGYPTKTDYIELTAMDNGCIKIELKNLPEKGTFTAWDNHEISVVDGTNTFDSRMWLDNSGEKTAYTYYWPFTEKGKEYTFYFSCKYKDKEGENLINHSANVAITAKATYKKQSDYVNFENFDKIKVTAEQNVEKNIFEYVFDTGDFSYTDIFPADKVNMVSGEWFLCAGGPIWNEGAVWAAGNSIMKDETDGFYSWSENYQKIFLFNGVTRVPAKWNDTSKIVQAIKDKDNVYSASVYLMYSIPEFGETVYYLPIWSEKLIYEPIYKNSPFTGTWGWTDDFEELYFSLQADGTAYFIESINGSVYYAYRGTWAPNDDGVNTSFNEYVGMGKTDWTRFGGTQDVSLIYDEDCLNWQRSSTYRMKFTKSSSTTNGGNISISLSNAYEPAIVITETEDTITFTLENSSVYKPMSTGWYVDGVGIETNEMTTSSITINKADYGTGNHMVTVGVMIDAMMTSVFSTTKYFTVE